MFGSQCKLDGWMDSSDGQRTSKVVWPNYLCDPRYKASGQKGCNNSIGKNNGISRDVSGQNKKSNGHLTVQVGWVVGEL